MELTRSTHGLVTGGASGLGLGIADALAARGLRITIADILPDLLVTSLSQRSECFNGVTLDVRDRGWLAANKRESRGEGWSCRHPH